MKNLMTGIHQQSRMLTPRFLLRVGGLPVNDIEDLRFVQSMQWQEKILTMERDLTASKEAVAEMLFQAVHRYKEQKAARRKLINLRRDIFNLRLPENTQDARALVEFLAPAESTVLLAWLDLWDMYHHTLIQGSTLLNQDLRQNREQLKRIINTPDFRKGILLSSPQLDLVIDPYLAADNLHLNREERTVERSLLEYLLRTAYKTSPFSTLTPVSLGMIENGATAQDVVLQLTSAKKVSFTRLNMIVLSRLTAQILAAPDVRPSLFVRVTNGWNIQRDKVIYVRRQPNLGDLGENASAPIDYIQENVIRLPVNPLLLTIIESIGDGREQKFATLVTTLWMQQNVQMTEVDVEKYLQHLLRLGFLIVPILQVDIHQAHPLVTYYRGLRTIDHPSIQILAAGLEEIDTKVQSYATASLDERRKLLTQIKQQLTGYSTMLSTPQTRIPLPRTVLYEDTALTPEKLAISSDHWSETLDALSEIQQILPIFDGQLTNKLATYGYFQARYGVGQRYDDFLSFANTFHQEFFQYLQYDEMNARGSNNDQHFHRRENYFQQAEISILNDARTAIADYMHTIGSEHTSDSDELLLDQNFLQSIASRISDLPGDLQSSTFFTQFARENGNPLLIINQVYTGLTVMFSRFAYCFTESQKDTLITALRSVLKQVQPPGAVFAELKGGYDATNLNLHPYVTPYELVCPGELSTRTEAEQISMEELFIQDDQEHRCLRLYSKRLKKEVIPLYLGFVTLLALPTIQRVLLNFSYQSFGSLHIWYGARRAKAEEKIIFYPRLRYKNVVLQRATWLIASQMQPVRAPGQSDADYFLSVTRWRKELNLPTKIFFVPDFQTNFKDSSIQADEGTQLSNYKPLYVDFENFFSVLLLEATTRKVRGAWQITEMLPGTDQLWFKQGDQSYVSEFIFEMHSMKNRENRDD